MAKKKNTEIVNNQEEKAIDQTAIDQTAIENPLTTPKKSVCQKIENATKYLSGQVLERHQIVRLLLLAIVSQEHILLIGPPGTGKSLLSKKMRDVLDLNHEHEYFERLLTKFSVPEEMFGPLSLKALENDQYIRKSDGYLPSAKLAFVDEIFKANSAILNSLLTILNERLFDQADHRLKVPLISLIGASNELPEISVDSDQENASGTQFLNRNLNALFDRFVFRDFLSYVSHQNFDQLLDFNPSKDKILAQDRLNLGDLIWIKENLSKVQINPQVLDMLADLRKSLRDMGIATSDRRWLKILHVLKVAALCENTRPDQQISIVQIWHLQLLPWMLWEKEDQIEEIKTLIASKLHDHFENFNQFNIEEHVNLIDAQVKKKQFFYMNKSKDDFQKTLETENEIKDFKLINETIQKLKNEIDPYYQITQSLSYSKDLWVYEPSSESPRHMFERKHAQLSKWHQTIVNAQKTMENLINIVEMPYDILNFPSNHHENTLTMIPCHVPENHSELKRSFWVSNSLVSFYHWVQIASHFNVQTDQKLSEVKTPTVFFSNLPVHSLSWFQAIEYCNALSTLHHIKPFYVIQPNQKVTFNLDAEGYRLLHSNEWEYAAYAGETCLYAGSNEVNDTVWYKDNTQQLQPIKRKKPNAWGLYDMVGNLLCWTNDDVILENQESLVSQKANTKNNFFFINDTAETTRNVFKVCRGAHFASTKEACGIPVAKNIEISEDANQQIGFRIARYFFNQQK
jgi:MoxR-like ATPase